MEEEPKPKTKKDPAPKYTAPPMTLLAAFRAAEAVEHIASLASAGDDDGFDAQTIRVLGAWRQVDNRWRKPKKPMPDGGRPTLAAWEWLVSGWEFDIAAVARAAGVSTAIARDQMDVLIGCRLVYPDGSVHAFALKAVRALLQDRLGGGKRGGGKGTKRRDDGEDDGDRN